MNYTVIEQQTSTAGQTSVLTQSRSTEQEAESVYHTVLAAAAISSVPVHAASLLNEQGVCLKRECYFHGEESEEE